MTKTVVELDIVGYSDVARNLEAHLGVKVVAMLNDQIQGFVDVGLTAVGKTREQVVKASNGDNAVIVFEHAEDAHKFAQAVHNRTLEHNDNAPNNKLSAQRWFRIGAATGELHEENGNIAGDVISRAYRLEAAGKPGDFIIDLATYDALSDRLKKEYSPEETVSGRRNESFQVRRCKMIRDFNVTTTEPTVIGILDLFDRLNPRNQNQLIMTIIDMSPEHRPSDSLTIFESRNKILDWAKNNKKLKDLQDALLDLIRRQSRP
ncbi:MAG: hypothetical protein V7L25_18580 [Nostoc sp.]|uniref:hypothetical protein n=1 Tax=Nostoc sp. TaxID=1180 RepID=UPI002FF0B408